MKGFIYFVKMYNKVLMISLTQKLERHVNMNVKDMLHNRL